MRVNPFCRVRYYQYNIYVYNQQMQESDNERKQKLHYTSMAAKLND